VESSSWHSRKRGYSVSSDSVLFVIACDAADVVSAEGKRSLT
jgi:hypothetical protein